MFEKVFRYILGFVLIGVVGCFVFGIAFSMIPGISPVVAMTATIGLFCIFLSLAMLATIAVLGLFFQNDTPNVENKQ